MKEIKYKLALSRDQKLLIEKVLQMRIMDLLESITSLEEYCPDWLNEEKEKTDNLLSYIKDLPF